MKQEQERRKMLFQEFAIKYLSLQDLKHSSRKSYEDRLRQYIYPVIGDKAIETIKKMDLDELVCGLRPRISASRINDVVSLLRIIFDDATENDLISHSPAAKLKREKIRRAPRMALGFEQIHQAIEALDSHFKPLFTFLALTGARPNEAFALKWESVDFGNRSIEIKAGRVAGVEGAPKSLAGYRTLLMPPALAAVLLPLRRDSGHVFLNRSGEPMNANDASNLSHIWKAALAKAGIAVENQSAYSLRHSFLSNALAGGVDLAYVSRQAGHASTRITQDNYIRPVDDRMKAEQEKLDTLLGARSRRLTALTKEA